MRLRWWGSVVFVSGTVAFAAVTALLLEVFSPPVDRVVIVLSVAVVLLTGGLIHEALARRLSERKQMERLVRMRQAYEDMVEVIGRVRTDMVKTRNVERAAEPPSPPAPVPYVPPPPVSPPRASPPSRAASGAAPRAVKSPPPVAAAAGDDEMAAIVRAAIAEQRVECHLQPIVGLPLRKHRGYEVLSRIRLTDGSVLDPDRYLTVAERERRLSTIDFLVLERAGQMIQETNRRRHAISFFCNIAPVTLSDPAFRGRFLGDEGDPRTLRPKLIFELSQRDFASALAEQPDIVDELGRAGFRFSMDQVEHFDMGVEGLADLHVRYVKLNRAFFADPEWRPAIIDLRQRLVGQGVAVIAEKIETEAQLHELEALGLELGQGFLFGEPRPSRRST